MTDQDREMIQFARSYHQAYEDYRFGALLNQFQANTRYKVLGEWTRTQHDGYVQAIREIMEKPLEIAPDDPPRGPGVRVRLL